MAHGISIKPSPLTNDIKFFIWRKFTKIALVNTHQTKPGYLFASFKATEEEQERIKVGIESEFPNLHVHHEGGWQEPGGRFCRLHIEILPEDKKDE